MTRFHWWVVGVCIAYAFWADRLDAMCYCAWPEGERYHLAFLLILFTILQLVSWIISLIRRPRF